jgi:hypothetical protein
MTGGGSFIASGGATVHHEFELDCNAQDSRLDINWGQGQRFRLETVTGVGCYDDPRIDSGNQTPMDTLVLTGIGSYTGKNDASISLVFTDAGEPGRNDGVQMLIKDGVGNVILNAPFTTLTGGNHQAHKAKGKDKDKDDDDDDDDDHGNGKGKGKDKDKN